MIKPAHEIIAYTNRPEQQLIRVDRGNFFEFYGAYTPNFGTNREQAGKVFGFVYGATEIAPENIVAARAFVASPQALKFFLSGEKEFFGREIPPRTLLHTKPCEPKARMAYQFEAIVPKNGEFSQQLVYDGFGNRVGTNLEFDGKKKLYLRGILGRDTRGDVRGPFLEQVQRMYKQQQAILKSCDYDYTDVDRVHLFLANMARDYDALNKVRNKHFKGRGISEKDNRLPPASTGIGIQAFPQNSLCVSDIIAEKGEVENREEKFCDSLLQSNTWTYQKPDTLGLENQVNFSRLALSDKAYVSGQSHIIEKESVYVKDDEFQKALRQTFVAGEILLMPHGLTMDDTLTKIAYIRGVSEHPERYEQFLGEAKKWMNPSFALVVLDARVCRENLYYEHGLEALSAPLKKMAGQNLERRLPILDFKYIPKHMEPRFGKLHEQLDGAVTVINRN